MSKRAAILIVITLLVLIYGVIYPNLFVVATSLQRDGAWTFANYREVLAQSVVLEAIVNSIGLSVFTVLLCAIVGVPLDTEFRPDLDRFDFCHETTAEKGAHFTRLIMKSWRSTRRHSSRACRTSPGSTACSARPGKRSTSARRASSGSGSARTSTRAGTARARS